MYQIDIFNPETGEFEQVATTDFAVRVRSTQYVPKTIFETDDPEYNG